MSFEHAIAFPNLFTYYEQDMAKSIILFDYYNNIYQGWFKRRQIMTAIKRGSHEWLKETITINEGNERLKLHK